MLYDYKTKDLVQDVVLECPCSLIEDITEEFYYLHRYENLGIYVPSVLAREIISRLLDEVDELWVHANSENELLYRNDKEVVITISYDGMIFVEDARNEKRKLKDNEDFSLSYIYDGFGKKDIDELVSNAESILVFGFDEEEIEMPKSECGVNCKETEKKTETSVKTATATATPSTSTKSSYIVNGKSVSKEEFDKKYAEFEDKYLDNVKDMLLRYCELMDAFNEYQKLFY